nr:type VII secretion-associated protein [Pseudonocardia sp. C8]
MAVPVAVAVLAVGPPPPAGPVLVVDAGTAGTEVAVVDDGIVTRVSPGGRGGAANPRNGRGAAASPGGGGGVARGDVRDVAVLRAVACRAGAVEVVVAGERAADDPGWVAAVAAAAPCPVRTAGPRADDDPAAVPGAGADTAAVLGAALLGAGLLAQVSRSPAATARFRESGGGPPGDGCTVPGAAAGRGGAGHTGRGEPGDSGRGEPPGTDRPGRGRLLLPAVAVLGAVLVAAGLALGGPERPAPAEDAVVVQYGYAAALPAGWEHTGGDPGRRRVLLTPVGRPDGADLIVVERSPLPYDAAREPIRLRRELAALLAGEAGVTPPAPVVVAGRTVLGYTQRPGDGTVVDWHVLPEAPDQLVVGCRRPAGAPPAPACAAVVGSVRPAP